MSAVWTTLFVIVLAGGVAWWASKDREYDRYIAGCRAMGQGMKFAALGFGREDYPMDYTEAEREAWQRGWDEYHERN